MDPNAQLAAIRVAMKSGAHQAALDGMADLDEWLSRGGFPPAAWMKQAAQPAATPARRDGETADGRPYRVIENYTETDRLYPKTNSFEFGCWPVLVLETGGYNDIEARDPWTGRTLWVGQIWSDTPPGTTPVAQALRRLADAFDQSGFGTTEDEDDA